MLFRRRFLLLLGLLATVAAFVAVAEIVKS
jgi:hypothetical protein